MIIDCSGEQSPDDLWLTANNAYELVCAHVGPELAAITIVERASVGLVRTRAEFASFEIKTPEGDKAAHRFSNATLPRDFWLAEAGNGLRQNWTSGDFSTSSEEGLVRKALGVAFEQRGIQAMLVATLPPASQTSNVTVPDRAKPPLNVPQKTDNEVIEKMKEMKERNLSRDDITKLIREEAEFEGVTNTRARGLYSAVSPRGRPQKNKQGN